jgi:DnaK suppressor protein
MTSARTHLTEAQLAALQVDLQQRQRQLDGRLAAHHAGLSRAEHAREVLLQDSDDAPQREAERELDMALSELETQELGAISGALRRLHAGTYGRCADCDSEIPFERLQIEPWALRCVACESARERA